MSSLKKILAGTVLAATAFVVIVPLESRATPSPGEDLEYVTNASPEACLPQFSVYFQLPERVIAIEQKDSCPVASQIYVHLANEERRFAIVAYQSRNYHNKWVSEQDPIADQGQYGVLHVEYSPGQFVSRLSQRDHRIVIVGQPHPVASPPTLEEEPTRLPPYPRQQEYRSEPAQVSLDAESKRILTSLLDRLRQLLGILARFRDFLNTLPLG